MIINDQAVQVVIQQTSEKCVDCGRRTSRNLKYCDVCRKAHFMSALRNIRYEPPPRSTISPSLSKPSLDGAANLEHEKSGKLVKKLGSAAAPSQRPAQKTFSSPRV
jgi:hypothetical protein